MHRASAYKRCLARAGMFQGLGALYFAPPYQAVPCSAPSCPTIGWNHTRTRDCEINMTPVWFSCRRDHTEYTRYLAATEVATGYTKLNDSVINSNKGNGNMWSALRHYSTIFTNGLTKIKNNLRMVGMRVRTQSPPENVWCVWSSSNNYRNIILCHKCRLSLPSNSHIAQNLPHWPVNPQTHHRKEYVNYFVTGHTV